MQPVGIEGVFRKKDRLFTINPDYCNGFEVYNEKIVKQNDREYRSWNPYRSKLAAAILKGLNNLSIESDSKVLYLGAATGTTVSHISDIVKDGVVYAVENSPVAMKKLLKLCKKRRNIVPILSDANHPDKYATLVPIVDFLYQDISQRNQSEIFLKNIMRYLRVNGQGVLMIKSRSIDVSLKPEKTYELVINELENNGLGIEKLIDLSPYEKDHAAILLSF
jgi:fibrillarin-like pre-rRNA processing protein